MVTLAYAACWLPALTVEHWLFMEITISLLLIQVRPFVNSRSSPVEYPVISEILEVLLTPFNMNVLTIWLVVATGYNARGRSSTISTMPIVDCSFLLHITMGPLVEFRLLRTTGPLVVVKDSTVPLINDASLNW